MRDGYKATAQRNYRRALDYFKAALVERPGDRYASAAVINMTNYINQRTPAMISFASGKPGRVTFGTTRTAKCLNQNDRGTSAIALVPSDMEAQLTTSAHPKLFFYIPESQKPVQGLEFRLLDKQQAKILYQDTVQPVKQGGVMVVDTGEKATLEPGKTYKWWATVICDFKSRGSDVKLEGEIQVVDDANISSGVQLETNPLERAKLYATGGFWENAISKLADLRRQDPQNAQINQYWTELLTSVELQEVAQKPLL